MKLTKKKTRGKSETRRKTKGKRKTRGKSSSKKQKSKILTLDAFNKLEFPYRHLAISKSQMKSDFAELRKYRGKFITYNPVKYKIAKFKNRNYILFVESFNDHNHLHKITDYFSHKCRVVCIFNLKESENILTLFTKNKKKILKELKGRKEELTLKNINEYLYRHHSQCTNFNTTMVMNILNLFKPKRWLDCSAGWGDRLVGAIAYGKCEYLGVDPSKCMQPVYKEIIKELGGASGKKYNVVCDGFENVKVKNNHYDLVFTSPPFFDLEVYEDEEEQSVEKFKTVDEWKRGFLFPLLKKSYNSLNKGGYLALYITDFKGSTYIKDMKNYVKHKVKGLQYQGDLHYFHKENKRTIRTIYIWKKD